MNIGLTTILLTTNLMLAGGVNDAALVNELHPPAVTKPRTFIVANNPNDDPKPKPQAPKPKPRPAIAYEIYEVTAYTPFCNTGCIGITKTGIDVRKSVLFKGKRIIAVDPRVIPLGSKVEIRLNSGKVIVAVAEDTGGDIKGRRIDFLVSTEDEAVDFGRQTAKVRIIRNR
ncbi:3D domain-containing protein [Gottfriedia sp. S16(2024)]|uniref:3D domain-containing protein n=1 Tax=Gottfriedia sp. S16(2024) TaxID=3162883 RepID=UPI003D2492CA